MSHFEGRPNQAELEIYYKKFINAFISLVEDHLDKENGDSDKDQSTLIPPAMPTAVHSCRP